MYLVHWFCFRAASPTKLVFLERGEGRLVQGVEVKFEITNDGKLFIINDQERKQFKKHFNRLEQQRESKQFNGGGCMSEYFQEVDQGVFWQSHDLDAVFGTSLYIEGLANPGICRDISKGIKNVKVMFTSEQMFQRQARRQAVIIDQITRPYNVKFRFSPP